MRQKVENAMAEVDQQTVREARAFLRERERRRLAEREELRERVLAGARAAIRHRAPEIPGLLSVYLFGSVTRSGRFGPRSDVDVAVEATDPAAESCLWRTLEDDLGRPFDVRPLVGPLVAEVRERGECVYAREDAPAGAHDPG